MSLLGDAWLAVNHYPQPYERYDAWDDDTLGAMRRMPALMAVAGVLPRTASLHVLGLPEDVAELCNAALQASDRSAACVVHWKREL